LATSQTREYYDQALAHRPRSHRAPGGSTRPMPRKPRASPHMSLGCCAPGRSSTYLRRRFRQLRYEARAVGQRGLSGLGGFG
jgi:hypothetical protein